MFGTQQRGVNAYAKVGLETGIVSASPHKLIVMLYDGALVAVLSAQMHMKSGNIPEKGKSISKAIQIIDNGLRASLDKKAGGQIAEGLDALYEYMSARLLAANIHNDLALLEEVQRLLTDLRETWNAIGSTPAAIPGADLKRMPSLASA
ncbi:flagellar protein FliS [Janthinobacterium sp. TND4EL3]|uniref:flagellar export chaperone FliS n=1 Tax=Janthinobacterium sp. TND4EL3 TaxID=1907311 RepID=UPI000953E8A0|nr:flagellar export chaperone FliS [Janthinobacterium sp. TND4EL3]SIQ84363.1 flagellar protein FliS [Janthinobacterium sp. TND4EL3]